MVGTITKEENFMAQQTLSEVLPSTKDMPIIGKALRREVADLIVALLNNGEKQRRI